MLRVWRESDGRELVRIGEPDAALPNFRDPPPQPIGTDASGKRILTQTQDGSIVVRDVWEVHFGSRDWYGTRVEEVATKKLLRVFP